MKALVLNSGGIDSTTCVALAIEKYGKENTSTASIFYGQKHSRELESANKIAEHYGINHYELNLSKIITKYHINVLLLLSRTIIVSLIIIVPVIWWWLLLLLLLIGENHYSSSSSSSSYSYNNWFMSLIYS